MLDTLRRCVGITLMESALYVPELAVRSRGHYLMLMSVQLATQDGARFSFAKDKDIILNTNREVVVLARHHGLI